MRQIPRCVTNTTVYQIKIIEEKSSSFIILYPADVYVLTNKTGLRNESTQKIKNWFEANLIFNNKFHSKVTF